MSSSQQSESWLQTGEWRDFPGLVHGFSKRISDREDALQKINASDLHLHTLKQVHGDQIVTVTQHSTMVEKPEADGLISSAPGVLLGIATADCVPVFMVDIKTNVVAALHAGWRGTLQGISVRAIELLCTQWKVEAHNLRIALGPAIGGCCYEVSPEVGETIVKRWRIRGASAWRPHGNKGFLDLREVNAEQIMESGVPRERIHFTGPCTFCSLDFASYRREGPNAGRQLSVIGWQKAADKIRNPKENR